MDIGTLTGQIAIEDQVSGVLNQLTSNLKEFALSFDGIMGGVAVGMVGVVAGVGAVSAAIVALGERGSDVNDLKATMDQFTGSVEASTAVLLGMRAGTLGVVNDFELMQSSSKLLAGGVKLTADNFQTLSSAAMVLSNQGLGPVENMLELVSQAMLTGQTRALGMKIGKIDLLKSENDYAKVLGTTRKDLTALEMVEAHRVGILEALNKKVKEAGEITASFSNRMQQAVAFVKNWFDELASAVAKSPQVMRAVDAIGAAFQRVFGGTSQDAINLVVDGINFFADAVTAVLPHVAEFLRLVRLGINFLWDYRNALLAVAAAYGTYKLAVMAANAWQAALALSAVNAGAGLMTATAGARAFIAAWGPVGLAVTGIAASMGIIYNAMKLGFENDARRKANTEQQIIDARNLAIINQRLGTSYTNLADAQKRTVQIGQGVTAANAIAAAAAAKLTEENERVGKIAAEMKEKVAEFYKQIVQGSQDLDISAAALRSLTKSQLENYDILSRAVPKIIELNIAHRALSPALLEAHARFVSLKLAIEEEDVAKMKDIGLTMEMVKHNQEIGITLSDMALFYGVTEAAINKYLVSLQKELAAKQGYAAFEEAFREQQRTDNQRRQENELATNKAIADFDESYQKRKTELYQTETQKRINQIIKEYNAQVVLLSVGKSEAEKARIRIAAARDMELAIDQLRMAEEQESAMMEHAGNTASDALNRMKAGYDAVNNAAKTAALDGLAEFFVMLGQITGGGLGEFLTAIGRIAAGFKSANDWSNQLGKDGARLGGNFGSLSVAFNKNASDAQRYAAAVQSAAVVAQGAANVWEATGQSASKAKNAWSGALVGAQAGAAFGPWGLVIGAAAGLIVGLVRSKPAWAAAASEVGRDFGVKISQGLSDAIAAEGKNRQAGSLIHLADIIKEGGGVTEKNVANFTSKLRDVFSMYEQGFVSTAEAVKILDDNFASLVAHNTDALGFWSDQLKEIVALNAKFKTNSQAIADALRGQAANLLHSFNLILVGTSKSREGYAALKKAVDDATDEIKKLNEESERGRGVEWTQKMTEAQEKLKKALEAQHNAGVGATRQLTDLGIIATAAFATAIAKGMSFNEALQAAQPGLSALRHAYEDLGMNIEDPFLRMLMVQSQILENQPELLAGVAGLSGALAAMTNLNMLNADSFAAMGRLAADMYARIQAEVAKTGLTGDDAARASLLPMQDYLHAAVKAAEDLKLPLDANTQELIDQSKALGIWKDKGPTAAEAMQLATENLTAAITRLTEALLGIPSSLPDPFADWNPPGGGSGSSPGVPPAWWNSGGERPVEESGADSGGVVKTSGPQRSSRDNVPMWVREGEVVVTPEQFAMMMASRVPHDVEPRAPRVPVTVDGQPRAGEGEKTIVFGVAPIIVDNPQAAQHAIDEFWRQLPKGLYSDRGDSRQTINALVEQQVKEALVKQGVVS